MAFNLKGVWSVAEAIFGAVDVSRKVLGGTEAPPQPDRAMQAVPGGLLGEVETRLTGVLVSALKEAFDRDAARLDAERAALDDQRRRAEEALRLELVRQAGDRTVTRLWVIGAGALAIWIVSVLFAMRLPEAFAGLPRGVLAAGWAALLGAIGCTLAAHAQVTCWMAAAHSSRAPASELPQGGPATVAPWLVLAGLALVAASLLLAL